MRKQHGFTIIELVMVIILLGILAISAIVKFVDLRGEALEAAEKATVGSVRSGITTYFAQNTAYPAALDTAADGAASKANPFFTNVLAQGGVAQDWSKNGFAYTGPAGTIYLYEPVSGEFK